MIKMTITDAAVVLQLLQLRERLEKARDEMAVERDSIKVCGIPFSLDANTHPLFAGADRAINDTIASIDARLDGYGIKAVDTIQSAPEPESGADENHDQHDAG